MHIVSRMYNKGKRIDAVAIGGSRLIVHHHSSITGKPALMPQCWQFSVAHFHSVCQMIGRIHGDIYHIDRVGRHDGIRIGAGFGNLTTSPHLRFSRAHRDRIIIDNIEFRNGKNQVMDTVTSSYCGKAIIYCRALVEFTSMPTERQHGTVHHLILDEIIGWIHCKNKVHRAITI